MDIKAKLFKPFISESARKLVQAVLLSDQIAEGSEVKIFEYEFSKTFSVSNVVALNSGSSALELAYEMAGIQSGDEVITPILTCTATNIPLVRRGAKIVFADIDLDLNIKIEDVKKKITEKTKAIVFVHFGGNARGLDDLVAICRERNIKLIEDAAQAVGNGNFGKGDFACVSLQAIKTLTSGDGGFLICRNEEDYAKAKRLRWFGYDRELKQKLGDTDLTEAGYKYHMNNVSAAIGRGNLAEIDRVFERRRSLAEIYRSYGLFAYTWLAGGYSERFGELQAEFMSKYGIEIGQHHYRNDRYTIFKPFKTDCPNMDLIEHKYFFVPYHHAIEDNMAHFIGQKLNEK